MRIGDKVISREKIDEVIDRVLALRAEGYSQQDVAEKVGIARTLISRLESIGEIRKGGTIALVGFPVANKEELTEVAEEEGVDYLLLMTDKERWNFIKESSGLELFNRTMQLIYEIRSYDKIIFIGSDMRIKLLSGVVDKDVIPISLGPSPIVGDRYVDPENLREIIRAIKGSSQGE